jgi:hypothetical protein
VPPEKFIVRSPCQAAPFLLFVDDRLERDNFAFDYLIASFAQQQMQEGGVILPMRAI